MKKNLIIILLLFVLIQAVAIFLIIRYTSRKVVYVDTIKLVNEYHLKKDLEKKGENSLLQYKNNIDSINTGLKINPGDQKLKQALTAQQNEFSYTYNAISKDINTQVWSRLNPLINKFGKANHYDIIVGANGMGTVLYGTDALDITDNVIQYANNAYEKGD